MTVFWRLLIYARPFLPRMMIAVLCMVLASVANLYIPWICKDLIDDVLVSKDGWMLNVFAFSILAVVFFRGLFSFVNTYQISYAGNGVVRDIRATMYEHLQKLSLPYFETGRTGGIMGYFINDAGLLQTTVVNDLVDFITESIVLVGSLAVMFYLNWQLSLLTLVIMPVGAGIIRAFGKKIRQAGREAQASFGDVVAVLEESVLGIKVVQSFVREAYSMERFRGQVHRNFSEQLRGIRLTSLLTPIVECLAAFFATFVIWYGGREVIAGNLTAGGLIAFLMYVVNLGNPIRKLTRVYANLQRGLAAADRIFAMLDTKPDIMDDPQAYELPPTEGRVVFDRVFFSYTRSEGSQPVIDDFSLRVEPGEVVALVGESGAGKTTVANLLLRFYDVGGGAVEVGGHDVRRVTLKSLREQIGFVSQDVMLFNGTIFDNIRYGRLDASLEEVVAAARAANAHEFIRDMPKGYETRLADLGRNLSGGQRQRIAIARALLKNPRILVLDEATSALDSENERAVQSAVSALMKGRTVFIIAHRLSSAQQADRIVVMAKGRIAETGRHDELLAADGAYAKLWLLAAKA